MNDHEEEELVERAKKDPEAFGVLFDQYYQHIFGYAYRRTMDVDVAKDITSEVFFKAFKNLWSFRWRGISISAWFYRIATNEINYYFRRKARRPTSLNKLMKENGFDLGAFDFSCSEENETETQLEHYLDFLEIQSKLKLLPAKYQEVIALKYFEGKRIKEICEILKKKEGTVKALISRGLEKLRKLV